MSATYNLGRIGLNLRGDFDAAASYEKLDVVFYDGSSYAAKSACTGVLPTNADFWTLLASGTPGTVASSDDLYRLGIQAGLTMASVSVVAYAPTNTGFNARCINNSSSGRTPRVSWIAIGIPDPARIG